MNFRPFRMFRHIIAASMLLITAGAGAEFYLRANPPASRAFVYSGTHPGLQTLLIPSADRHHQLVSALPAGSRSSILHPDVRINSDGCRGDELRVPKPADVYRILVLGDETVFGPHCADQRQLTSLLQQFLEKNSTMTIEVVNGGVPGYCPLLSLLQFQQQLSRLSPDLIILHFDMSDVADDLACRRFLREQDGIRTCPHPGLQMPVRESMLSAAVRGVKHSALATSLLARSRDYLTTTSSASSAGNRMENRMEWIADSPPDLRIPVRHAIGPLSELNRLAAVGGFRFVVTTCPVLWQLRPASDAEQLSERCGIRGATPFRSELPFQVLRQYCTAEGILFCDSTPAFRSAPEGERLFSHEIPVPSDTGMALYAREIALFLLTSLGKNP